MTFITYIYDCFVKPSNIAKDRNARYSIYIYLISMLCMTLATTLISNTGKSVASIIFLFASIVVYFGITSIINVSILHFIISLFYKYKPKHSLKTLLVDVLFIHKMFIMLLPLSLLLSILPEDLYRVFFIIAFVCLYVYYAYYFYKVINVNVKLETQSQAIFLLIMLYVISNIIGMLLSLSNIFVTINMLSSFLS